MRSCGSDGASDATEKAVWFGRNPSCVQYGCGVAAAKDWEEWTHGRAAKVSEGGGAEVVEVVGGWVEGGVFSLQWRRGGGEGRGEEVESRSRGGKGMPGTGIACRPLGQGKWRSEDALIAGGAESQNYTSIGHLFFPRNTGCS